MIKYITKIYQAKAKVYFALIKGIVLVKVVATSTKKVPISKMVNGCFKKRKDSFCPFRSLNINPIKSKAINGSVGTLKLKPPGKSFNGMESGAAKATKKINLSV